MDSSGVKVPALAPKLSRERAKSHGSKEELEAQSASNPTAVGELGLSPRKREKKKKERTITPKMKEAAKRMKDAATWQAESLECSKLEVTFLPKGLFRITSLKTLVLANNLLTEIPNSMSKLANLKTLEIQHNKLRAFPEVVLSLPKLKTLSLHRNRIPYVPDTITTLQKLTFFHIFGNKPLRYPPYSVVGMDKVANNKDVVFEYVKTHSFDHFLKEERARRHERKRSRSKSPKVHQSLTSIKRETAHTQPSTMDKRPSLPAIKKKNTESGSARLVRTTGSKNLPKIQEFK